MNFMKLFVTAVSLLPSVIEGTESLFGENSGAQKKAAAVDVVGAAIHLADAVSQKQIADPEKFKAGLSMVIDGVVECLNASLWAKP